MRLRTIRFGSILLVCILLFVIISVSNLERSRQAQDIRQLEQVLHRTAVACYAVEGVYPPSVAYMQDHYGLTYDEGRYVVHYNLVASNFMPDIEVMERHYGE